MPKQIVIAEQLRIAAVLANGKVEELIVAQGRYQIGDIYLGTVENVLPGIDAAFVNIGESEKNGFIHVTDLGPLKLKKGAFGITELLAPRQEVLVQVMKEPTGSKGPRLTGNISLPGRYLVLQPNNQGVNISRKINSEAERNRLRALGVLIKPPGSGLLIRSESNGISEELLINDLESLVKQWDAIQQASEASNPPVLLNRDEDFIQRVLRDHIDSTITKVVVDNIYSAEKANNILSKTEENISVESHPEPNQLLNHFRINSAIQDALRPRVDLPSGGYIIIEPTEALTVIDVNSGSFTRSANARETVLWTNCEAAVEIARQLKLRNIGGVIIIDFIDMESRKDQLQLLEHFTSSIKNDSARPQIAQLTELGLVELTRKRQGQNIYELFAQPCPHCYGHGHIAILPGESNLEPLAIASGIVKSKDLYNQETNESTNSRKKKIGKNASKSIEDTNFQAISETNNSLEANVSISEINEATNPGEITPNSHSNQPELIGVNMNSNQEEVFSLLGLNPILLLDSPPETDNFLVRIVRPDESVEVVLEESKNQLELNAKKPRRRSRHNNTKISNKIFNEDISANEVSLQNNIHMPEPIDESNHPESINLENDEKTIIESDKDQITLSPESSDQTKVEEDSDEPRRRRRRSSASDSGE